MERATAAQTVVEWKAARRAVIRAAGLELAAAAMAVDMAMAAEEEEGVAEYTSCNSCIRR